MHQILERNLQELQGKLKGKSVILLKERETLTYHQHGRLMQKFKVKRQVKPKLNEKEKIINTSQISTDTHHSNSKSCLVRGQQAVHSGQLSHKSQRKLRPSFPHLPGKRNRSSNTAHRPPDARCGSRGPPFGAQAEFAQAEVPGPPSSDSA